MNIGIYSLNTNTYTRREWMLITGNESKRFIFHGSRWWFLQKLSEKYSKSCHKFEAEQN